MTDFHDIRFPLHLAFGSRGGPVRAVDIVQLANGGETRNAKTQHSRRRYNAVAGLKSREQALELLQFFEARYGPLYGFRFRDPLDHDANNRIAVGDGVRTIFPLTKIYGAPPQSYLRRISKPVSGTVRVFVEGVEMAVSTDHHAGQIQFADAPHEGAEISAQFEFDVPVRFASDALDIVLDDFGAAQIQDIPLIEILHNEAGQHG